MEDKDVTSTLKNEIDVNNDRQMIEFHENIAEGIGIIINYFEWTYKEATKNEGYEKMAKMFESYIKGLEVVLRFHLVERDFIQTIIDKKEFEEQLKQD